MRVLPGAVTCLAPGSLFLLSPCAAWSCTPLSSCPHRGRGGSGLYPIPWPETGTSPGPKGLSPYFQVRERVRVRADAPSFSEGPPMACEPQWHREAASHGACSSVGRRLPGEGAPACHELGTA